MRKEVADHCSDLLRMSLEREAVRIEEMDRRTRNIASECLGILRQEEGIVLSKYGQEMWFACPEVIFESW